MSTQADAFDLSTLDISIDGETYNSHDGDGTYSDEEEDDLPDIFTWKVDFSYGTVYGEAKCSDTPGVQELPGSMYNYDPDGPHC